MAKRRRSSSSFRLNAPTKIVFLISLVIAVLAIIAEYARIPNVTREIAFWAGIVAYVVLALACVMKGL